MIETLSPFTRRFIAIGLLVLTVVSGLSFVILPVVQWASTSLTALADSRFEKAQLEAIVARPAPPPPSALPGGAVMLAKDEALARATLSVLLTRIASANQVTISTYSPVTSANPTEHLILANLTVEGSEQGVVTFVEAVELGQPLVRFRSWRISRGDNGKIRLMGEIAAAWERRS